MSGDPQTCLQPLAEEPSITGFVSTAFRGWRGAGIPFLVLRNYRDLPASTANDIDVLVGPRDLRAAESALVAAAQTCGFRLHNRGEFATLALYFSGVDSTTQVHFDLFTDLKWRGFDFLDCSEFLEHRVGGELFDVPHPAHEAATNLMAYLIFAGKVKEKYRRSIHDGFVAHRQLAAELLARSYGSGNAQFILESGLQERWAEIEARTPALRRALIARQLVREPLKTAGSLLRDCFRFVHRLLHPPGMTVVVCGPDGCGKSTAANAVIELLRPTFSPEKGAHFHWKPPLFSARRRAVRPPTTSPHAVPPRAAPISLLFFALHWLEFFLGFFFCVLPRTFRGGMVLIDRYYYDFFVDQRRYRLQVPQFLVRFGYLFLPKPDVAFLLDAPPETLQSRKQEVALSETVRQREAFLDLAAQQEEMQVVDAGRTPAEVATAVAGKVLTFSARRFSTLP